jgi:hypothetical protein
MHMLVVAVVFPHRRCLREVSYGASHSIFSPAGACWLRSGVQAVHAISAVNSERCWGWRSCNARG